MKVKELINALSDNLEVEVVILDHQVEFKICCIKSNEEKQRIEINIASLEQIEEARDRIRRAVMHVVKGENNGMY